VVKTTMGEKPNLGEGLLTARNNDNLYGNRSL
jgi:hypothetical protein